MAKVLVLYYSSYGHIETMASAIAEGARRLGVSIHQDCAARGLETSAGRVSGVVTEKGTIRTSAVLLAGGVWTSMFCRHHGIDLPLAGVRSTSFFTAPAPEVTDPAQIITAPESVPAAPHE